jgi:hypothetical protein
LISNDNKEHDLDVSTTPRVGWRQKYHVADDSTIAFQQSQVHLNMVVLT